MLALPRWQIERAGGQSLVVAVAAGGIIMTLFVAAALRISGVFTLGPPQRKSMSSMSVSEPSLWGPGSVALTFPSSSLRPLSRSMTRARKHWLR